MKVGYKNKRRKAKKHAKHKAEPDAAGALADEIAAIGELTHMTHTPSYIRLRLHCDTHESCGMIVLKCERMYAMVGCLGDQLVHT